MQEDSGEAVLRVLGLQTARQPIAARKFTPSHKHKPAIGKAAPQPAAVGAATSSSTGYSGSRAHAALKIKEDDNGIPASDAVTITISAAPTQSFHGMDTLIEAIRVAPKTPNLFAKELDDEDTSDSLPSTSGKKRPRNFSGLHNVVHGAATHTRARMRRNPRKQAALAKVASFISMMDACGKEVSEHGKDSPSTVTEDVSGWYNNQILPQSFGALPFKCLNVYLNKGDEGLGLRLMNVDGKAVVAAVMRQDGVNVQPHDVIVAVDEVDASEAPFDKMIQKLRATKGMVCLRIARPDHVPVAI